MRAWFDKHLTAALENGRWLHHIWWQFSDRGWYRAWRPMCWLRGYHVPHHCDMRFENCVYCWEPLWTRSRDGYPNPYTNPPVDKAPLRKR